MFERTQDTIIKSILQPLQCKLYVSARTTAPKAQLCPNSSVLKSWCDPSIASKLALQSMHCHALMFKRIVAHVLHVYRDIGKYVVRWTGSIEHCCWACTGRSGHTLASEVHDLSSRHDGIYCSQPSEHSAQHRLCCTQSPYIGMRVSQPFQQGFHRSVCGE